MTGIITERHHSFILNIYYNNIINSLMNVYGRELGVVWLRSFYLYFFRHAAVKSWLRSPTAGEILVVTVQAGPVIGKLFVATLLYSQEESPRAVGHRFALVQAFARVFVLDATLHEGFVLLGTVDAIVMRGAHQHSWSHLQLFHIQLQVRNWRRHLLLFFYSLVSSLRLKVKTRAWRPFTIQTRV